MNGKNQVALHSEMKNVKKTSKRIVKIESKFF